jgi:PhnB protein
MKTQPIFTPELIIANGITDIDFYKEAFGATELRRFSNDDGSLHVAEMEINGSMFHIHEQNEGYNASPTALNHTTVIIGLFVDDVDAVVEKAVKAGATVIHPPQDYFYGYRQAEIADPFGHRWQIEKAI